MIQVQVGMDKFGNIYAIPISRVVKEKISNHLKKMNALDKSPILFLQQGMGAEDFIHEELYSKTEDELLRGYDKMILIDPWVFAHYYGYDTHKLFEQG